MKKFIDLEDMVNLNCSNVLNIIQKNGEVSRKQITELSGLSWGGMTKIVNKLLENGYIVEKKSENITGSGRIPCVISVNTDRNFVVGLDINQTGLNAIVMNLKGEILKSFSKIPSTNSKDIFINDILTLLKEVFSNFKKDSIISIGVAMQGIVDSKQGISLKLPPINNWKNIEIKKILEKEFNVDVFVEHDPDCLLYPHIIDRKKENTILLRIDKSVGMAVSVDGHIIKGTGILEIAHNIVVPNGKKCSCGNSGCLEAYVSTCIENPEHIKELISPLCITIFNLSGIFNADKVILTGKLMERRDLLERDLKQQLAKYNKDFELEFVELSEFAVQGAALIAVKKSINALLL